MSHWNPVTKTSSICQVCQSQYRAEIEKQISEGKTLTAISQWAAKQNPPEEVSRHSLQRHKKSHGFKIRVMGKDKKGENVGMDEIHLETLNDFLDLVIEKVQQGVKSGHLKPTVMEGVKAAEIKGKIKEGSKFEKELVKFFMEVSQQHGYSN